MALGTKTKLVDLAGKAEADTPEHTPQHHPHHHQNHHHQKRVRHTQYIYYSCQRQLILGRVSSPDLCSKWGDFNFQVEVPRTFSISLGRFKLARPSCIHYCLLTIQHGQGGGGFLCCCAKVTPDAEDRVELAFRRIDLNNDGFITWEEFVQVRLQCGDNALSLETKISD